jgi:aspartate/methionine/tyrosine aminotransferase
MDIRPFALERYFAEYEFSAPYLLSCSDCESLTLQEVLDSASSELRALWNELSLGYTESTGHPLLRREITELYRGIDPEDVLVVIPEEGIYTAMRSILSPGDHVVCTFPGYQSLYEVARSMGCSVSFWKPRYNGASWKFDPDDLEEQLREHTAMIVMNFPHNPTGAVLSRHELERVAEMAEKRKAVLFSDEMYRFLESEPEKRTPSASELYERSISLCGMSKTFSLPGLRIGWLVTRDDELRQACALYKDYTSICSSAPSELLAVMGLQNREAVISRNRQIIRNNFDAAERYAAQYPDLFRFSRPAAGPIAFCELLVDAPASEVCRKAVEEAGIMVLPASLYAYPDKFFRIGCGRTAFQEAFSRFMDFLAVYRM